VSAAGDALRPFLLERFAEFLTLEQGSAARTDESYGRDLRRLAEWAAAHGVLGPEALTASHLREFVYALKDLGLSPASIRRNVSAIRTWYRFLLADGVVTADPSERLETPKKWRTLPEVLTAAEVGASSAPFRSMTRSPLGTGRCSNSPMAPACAWGSGLRSRSAT